MEELTLYGAVIVWAIGFVGLTLTCKQDEPNDLIKWTALAAWPLSLTIACGAFLYMVLWPVAPERTP